MVMHKNQSIKTTENAECNYQFSFVILKWYETNWLMQYSYYNGHAFVFKAILIDKFM